MVFPNSKKLNTLETTVTGIDPFIRIIPTRFGRIRSKNPLMKIKINSRNSKEVYLELREQGQFQRFKLECFSESTARLVMKTLEEGF